MTTKTALRLALFAKYNGPRYRCSHCGRMTIHNGPCSACHGPVAPI